MPSHRHHGEGSQGFLACGPASTYVDAVWTADTPGDLIHQEAEKEMKLCKVCGNDVDKNKKWGYVNICEDCEDTERLEPKHMAVMTTDDADANVTVHVVRKPSKQEAAIIAALGNNALPELDEEV